MLDYAFRFFFFFFSPLMALMLPLLRADADAACHY